ncbi:tannase/feruloyl esterase family alpha/beta hydrolase [Paracoccaceae bacterium GXU_MW_L88]
MKAILYSTAVLAVATPVFALDCDGLTPEAIGLEGVTFTEVTAVPAGEESPVPQCQIRGRMAERTGTDGRDYALSFELALPEEWNGNFAHQFNGGNDGRVVPATGGRAAGTGETSALERGFAVISSDAGHDSANFEDRGLASGAAFGFDFEARQMYGYKAVEVLQPVAVQMVEAYYEKPISYTYGIGCSNGGRHGMVAAARLPDAFDGLLIGAPGFNLPRAAVQHAHDVQTLAPLTGDLRTAFTQEELSLVADAIRGRCDALDGLDDGLVSDWQGCQMQFDITALTCGESESNMCLPEEKIAALQALHEGPKDASGSEIYNDWAWDPGIEGSDWRSWKIESPVAPWDNLPIIATQGASSLAQVFTVPPTEVEGTPEAMLDFLLNFDIEAEAEQITATSEAFPESAMEVMTPPGSDNPVLAEFRDAGGKMIVYHGVSDGVFSVNDTADWYEALNLNNEGQAANFARFFPVPGMNHCDGGPALDLFDLLTPLVAWVEDGTPAEVATATARADNDELPADLVGAERPLCSSPQVAKYQAGDPLSADSFQCE